MSRWYAHPQTHLYVSEHKVLKEAVKNCHPGQQLASTDFTIALPQFLRNCRIGLPHGSGDILAPAGKHESLNGPCQKSHLDTTIISYSDDAIQSAPSMALLSLCHLLGMRGTGQLLCHCQYRGCTCARYHVQVVLIHVPAFS